MRRIAGGLAALVLAAVAVFVAAEASAAPPLWLAVRGQTRLYLFGSVHLLPAGLDWEPPALADVQRRARWLWFEIPIDAASDAAAARQAAAKGALPAGESLWSVLPAPVAAKVKRAALAVSVSPAALAHDRPWLADVALSLAADIAGGGSAGDGVERRVQAATPLAVGRRAFETAGQQIDFLADAPRSDQIASLEATAEEILDRPATYHRVLTAWLAGDLATLRRDALAPLERASPALFARLITERNRRWARLLDRDREAGVGLIVVGMGHLIGPDGLPALLARSGWTVTSVTESDRARAPD